MDALQFEKYLTQPLALAHLAVSELLALVEKYPYCAPLRLLLLKKYQLQDESLLEENLPKQVTYTPDRLRLYEYLQLSPQYLSQQKDLPKQAVFVSENPPSISASELGLEKKTLIPTDLSFAFDNLMIFNSLNHHLNSDLAQQIMPEKFPKEPLRKKESADKAKTKNTKKRFRLPRIPTLEDANVLDLFANNIDSKNESSSLYTLEDTFNINHVDDAFKFLSQTEEFLKSISQRAKRFSDAPIEEDYNESVDNKELAQQQDLDALAMESVTDNESIASETLAQLLAKQGQVQKAINMYKKLAAQHTQKTAYFEQKIEELKTKK